ncbi:MAG: ABC transporter permease subunit [Gammaproteobacteria bacterium]|jgi:NitT/TauT family transport system permease protein|nr:ABC transporter permease subunit [Gammaproteobacteria bacterium]
MTNKSYYSKPQSKSNFPLNQWDLIILVLLFGVLASLVWGAQQMAAPYELGKQIPISLDPSMLPRYAIATIIRMAIALFFSLLFTFTVATLAAKSHRAERFILPFIDIMQSVPILGFLSITILAFIYLFPGSQLGPECAAIFAIFTSQVWNMALSFYQSLRTVPKDLKEAADMFRLSPWQRFWRLEVPFATPSLIWNMMMSLSAGWFFVVASEAISVNNQSITLPGIGSYIYVATQQTNYVAISYAILTMLIIILVYDQLIFRPLIAWSEKFKIESNPETDTETWFLNLLHRAHLIHYVIYSFRYLRDLITIPFFSKKHKTISLPPRVQHALSWTMVTFWNSVLFIGIVGSSLILARFIYTEVHLSEVLQVFGLGAITAVKIAILVCLCSIFWVPIGVWIGLKPKVAAFIQPIAQFFAAFPANLVYPVLYMLILKYDLNINIWASPLLILGTQWYILFNVVAGASSLPQELHLVAQNYGLRGWIWWRKLILPAIFPYYITGAMTAVGGSWNASIVAEVVNWGGETLHSTGLGSYIAQYTSVGDFPRIGLGIAVMSIYVIVINRFVWQKLYDFAEERFHIG